MSGLFLVIIAAVCCGIAAILYVVGADAHPEVAPAFFAAGCGVGFLGVKLP